MRHLVAALCIPTVLACGACSTVPGQQSSLQLAADQAGAALITKIKDEPSAPFCLANTANRNFRKTGLTKNGLAAASQTVGALTYFGCLALGGQPSAVAPRTAAAATPTKAVASAQ